jgi:hypothetical protein
MTTAERTLSEPAIIHVRADYAGRCWSASFFSADGSADPDTMAAFGTETLPLPWALQAPYSAVLDDLHARFPLANVVRV